MAQSPPVRRLQLGRELKRLREAAHVTRERAASELECDVSKLSRLETGKLTIRAAEVRALARLYGAADDVTDAVLALAREARKRTAYRVPDWARTFVGLEAEAAEIKMFNANLVPGLMQTKDYARAVTRAADPTRNMAEVERLVALRGERQARLSGDDPPQLWVVIDEAVLRREVGSPTVMREQLSRLIELSRLPKVSLQVLPFRAGAHAALGSSFVVLRLADPPDAEFVYLEDLWNADYVDRPPQVRTYGVAFDRLCDTALDPDASAQMIEQVFQEPT